MRLLDRVQETATDGGTGPITLNGAVSGFRSFEDAVVDTEQFYYVITMAGDWECGIGYTASGDLIRAKVLANHANTTDPVDFFSGEKQIFSDASTLAAFFNPNHFDLANQATRPDQNTTRNLEYLFGTGVDGDVTLVTDQTITETKHYRNLTITGGKIQVNGVRIFVQNLLLITGGELTVSGADAIQSTAPGSGTAGECTFGIGNVPNGGQSNDGPNDTTGYPGESVSLGAGGAGGDGGAGGNV